MPYQEGTLSYSLLCLLSHLSLLLSCLPSCYLTFPFSVWPSSCLLFAYTCLCLTAYYPSIYTPLLFLPPCLEHVCLPTPIKPCTCLPFLLPACGDLLQRILLYLSLPFLSYIGTWTGRAVCVCIFVPLHLRFRQTLCGWHAGHAHGWHGSMAWFLFFIHRGRHERGLPPADMFWHKLYF